MGLDGVELVVAVENSFKIAIDDEEAVTALTPGELLGIVMAKLEPASSRGCITSHTFYRLRAAVADLRSLRSHSLVPATRTDALWPASQRRQAWKALAERTDLDLPALERPPAVVWVAAIIVTLVTGLVGYVLSAGFGGVRPAWLAWVVAASSAAGLGRLAASATRPTARRLPPACMTLGGLTRELVMLNFGVLAAEQQQWREAEVWETLQDIIARQLAVKKEDVTKEASFVDDLGLN